MDHNMSKTYYLRIASILIAVWAVFMLMSATAIGIPAIAANKNYTFPIILFVAGIMLFLISYALSKRKKTAGIVGLVIGIAGFFFYILLPAYINIIGIVLSLAVIIVLTIGWKEFTDSIPAA